MRAICESCARPQPLDWRAGDHCVWCGQAVRREVRCFWCANWTPAVKFCRTCGAATVDSARLRRGPHAQGRRLRPFHRFRASSPNSIRTRSRTSPASTRSMPPSLRITWSRSSFWSSIWSRSTGARALEQSLAPQLPWPLERLDAMRAAAKRVPATGGRRSRKRAPSAMRRRSPTRGRCLRSPGSRWRIGPRSMKRWDWSAVADEALQDGSGARGVALAGVVWSGPAVAPP